VIYSGGGMNYTPGTASHYSAVMTGDLLELRCLKTQDITTATFRGISGPPLEDPILFRMSDLVDVIQEDASSIKLLENREMNTTVRKMILKTHRKGEEREKEIGWGSSE